MKYTKPKVTILGEAVRVIEHQTGKGAITVFDGQPMSGNAAYDLDE